jgi:hypothetical protein
MELVKLHISPEFIQARTYLTWRQVLFGMENELISSGAATEFAAQQLAEQQCPSPALLELASLSEGESTLHFVRRLAAAEASEDIGEVQKKWLYLVLAWIFDRKDAYSDPLGAVETVYADFGYPENIAGFVRYMPMQDADLGSKEANEKRLYDKWKAFLDEASAEYRR